MKDDGSASVSGAGRRDGGITVAALRVLVAVVDAKSFSGAARALGISQPSVSVQLAALEAVCGVPLILRKPAIEPTEVGRDLYRRARLVLSRVEEFEASLQEFRDLRRGRLNVGLSTPHFAMPLIAAFLKRHPSIQVSTRIGNTASLLDEVARCRIEIGIMTLLGPHPEFACTLIAAPRLSICVGRDDPLAGRAAVRPADLAETDLILREEGSMTRQVLEAAFLAAGVVPRVKLVLASREAMKEAVSAGLGVGALFDGELGPDPRLAAVPIEPATARTGVYAVVLPETLEIPTVRSFLDMAVAGRAAG